MKPSADQSRDGCSPFERAISDHSVGILAARSAPDQERRIGHVRGMSAEPSATEVGVPIGDIG
jgi:hypothetical protein